MDYRAYVKELIEEISKNVATDAVFGASREIADKVVIPVAQVAYSGGGGFGRGIDESAEESGTGGGMGLSLKTKPLGVIIVTEDEVQWMPVLDVTRIAILGCAVAIAALMLLRCMSMCASCQCGD